jgi:uncharacterized protein YkwD
MPRRAHKPILAALIVLIACASAWPAGAAAARSHRKARTARTCAGAGTPATSSSNRAMRAAVLCLINQQRADHGLPALRESGLLDRSAQGWTNVMVATRNFWHGVNFAARITAVGFVWRDAGENIATGFPTPASVVTAWMASKDHCQNILGPHYSRVGTGLSRRAVGSFASRPSTWTQDFALPMLGRVPSQNTGPERGCPY